MPSPVLRLSTLACSRRLRVTTGPTSCKVDGQAGWWEWIMNFPLGKESCSMSCDSLLLKRKRNLVQLGLDFQWLGTQNERPFWIPSARILGQRKRTKGRCSGDHCQILPPQTDKSYKDGFFLAPKSLKSSSTIKETNKLVTHYLQILISNEN